MKTLLLHTNTTSCMSMLTAQYFPSVNLLLEKSKMFLNMSLAELPWTWYIFIHLFEIRIIYYKSKHILLTLAH